MTLACLADGSTQSRGALPLRREGVHERGRALAVVQGSERAAHEMVVDGACGAAGGAAPAPTWAPAASPRRSTASCSASHAAACAPPAPCSAPAAPACRSAVHQLNMTRPRISGPLCTRERTRPTSADRQRPVAVVPASRHHLPSSSPQLSYSYT